MWDNGKDEFEENMHSYFLNKILHFSKILFKKLVQKNRK